jgi:hypothetical protein
MFARLKSNPIKKARRPSAVQINNKNPAVISHAGLLDE